MNHCFSNKKRFCMSGSAFWGWYTDIDLEEIDSIEGIEQELRVRLSSWIDCIENITDQNDLHGLRRALDNIKMHFHGMTFENMVNHDDTIYVCHCDEKHTSCHELVT